LSGVRLESDLLVVPADTKYGWGSRRYLRFDYCTPVPFCPNLIDTSLLSLDDKQWIDAFHATCRDKLTSALLLQAASSAASPEAQMEDLQRSLSWIERCTRPLG
jgi:Xaa-Pro aminopeptidase